MVSGRRTFGGEGGGTKSQPSQRLGGPRRRAVMPGLRPRSKSQAAFDGGDLFSVGLYMAAPHPGEEALPKVTDLSKGQEEGDRYRGGFWGQRSLEASVIRIIAMFLVPISSSPLSLRGLIFKSEL